MEDLRTTSWVCIASLHQAFPDTRTVDCYIVNNNLSGTLPKELRFLRYLLNLNFWENNLVGTIPFDILGQHMKYLYLNDNNLEGTISPSISQLSNLKHLGLANNQLTGSIPSGIGKLTSLLELNMGTNVLSGSIPSETGALPTLVQLLLGNNLLTGAIPSDTFSNCSSSLTLLSLQENLLNQTIPDSISTCSSLDMLNLRSNDLTGEIPPMVGNLNDLRSLALSENALTGTLPATMQKLHRLEHLDLGTNHLTGSIDALWNLTNLVFFTVPDNSFTGTALRTEIGLFTNLRYLSLDHNEKLTGRWVAWLYYISEL
mmetsp:Transcript_27870/g.67806  ORF Transcript_27870/g.67806 Transcript_27870/m.67806 type:complete len:315 (-) Transcript_27870:647-1591(-)